MLSKDNKMGRKKFLEFFGFDPLENTSLGNAFFTLAK